SYKIINSNWQKYSNKLNDILNNQNESEIIPRKIYTYIIGKNKNLNSPEARYQEVEITEDDRIYDILRKMDRIYLLPYK
ncbi:25733_t:CDS:2, partial [Gigaspora margarita]